MSIFNLKHNQNPKTICLSIGRGCHTAMHLNLLGLRKGSYPFDWIVPVQDCLNIETRIQFLLNGFENFFNKEDLIKTDIENTSSKHYIVFNKYSGFYFAHDFDIIKTMDENYKCVLEKYERRGKRLINHLKKAENIYVFYMSNTWDHLGETDYEIPNDTWKMLMYRLQKKYPNKNFQLLIFSHNEKFDKFDYETNIIAQNITKYFSNHTYTKNGDDMGLILSIEKIINDRFIITQDKNVITERKNNEK